MRQYNHKRLDFKAFDKQAYNFIFCSATEPNLGQMALPCSTALVYLLLQQFKGELCDVLPRFVHMVRLSTAGTDAEAQHEPSRELARHQMDLSALCDPLQQRLVQLIGALDSEADQAQHHLCTDLKPLVCSDQALKLFGQCYMLAYMSLHLFNSMHAEDKPHFQRAKSSSKWDLPVPIISDQP